MSKFIERRTKDYTGRNTYEVSIDVHWTPTVIVEAESEEAAMAVPADDLFQMAIEQGDLPQPSDIDVEWAQEARA